MPTLDRPTTAQRQLQQQHHQQQQQQQQYYSSSGNFTNDDRRGTTDPSIILRSSPKRGSILPAGSCTITTNLKHFSFHTGRKERVVTRLLRLRSGRRLLRLLSSECDMIAEIAITSGLPDLFGGICPFSLVG